MDSVDPFLRSPIWDWDAVTGEDALDDDDTGSDCTFNIVSSWVEKCLTNHTACRDINVTEDPLPTRVIDVGLLDGTLLPKLIEGCGRYGKYAALSHCWGPPSGPEPLRTTLSTLRARRSSIPLAILPATFVHALYICRKLNIPYLWIDSLCIIQDSVSDWVQESAQMCDIYRNSYLTIASTHAKDSSEGCFVRRDGLLTRPIHLPIRGLGHFSTEIKQLFFKSPYSFDVETENPWSERAWTLQEWILSPRILFYSKMDVGWECLTTRYSELEHVHGPMEFLGELRAAVLGSVTSFQSLKLNSSLRLHSEWTKIVEKYSLRQLTKPSDNLVAIYGVAKALERASKDTYYAGLFGKWLIKDLLWYSISRKIQGKAITSIAPSWSWAFSTGPIRFLGLHSLTLPVNDILPIARILDVNVTGPPASQTGVLTIEGDSKLIIGKFGGIPAYALLNRIGKHALSKDISSMSCAVTDHSGLMPLKACWFPDVDCFREMHTQTDEESRQGQRLSDREYQFHFIAIAVHRSPNGDTYLQLVVCLVLFPIDIAKRRFRRVGIALWDWEEWFGKKSPGSGKKLHRKVMRPVDREDSKFWTVYERIVHRGLSPWEGSLNEVQPSADSSKWYDDDMDVQRAKFEVT